MYNLQSSKLTLRQKAHFVEMMQKMNADNFTQWNLNTLRYGGYDVTPLSYGDGLTVEEVQNCWSISQLMTKDELYSLHIDLPNLYFKLPPVDPDPDGN